MQSPVGGVQATTCKTCRGEKTVKSDDGKRHRCPTCNGTGKRRGYATK